MTSSPPLGLNPYLHTMTWNLFFKSIQPVHVHGDTYCPHINVDQNDRKLYNRGLCSTIAIMSECKESGCLQREQPLNENNLSSSRPSEEQRISSTDINHDNSGLGSNNKCVCFNDLKHYKYENPLGYWKYA